MTINGKQYRDMKDYLKSQIQHRQAEEKKRGAVLDNINYLRINKTEALSIYQSALRGTL